MSHTQNLSGKVALVTGASSGIGEAIAKRLAADGASVVITGRRQAELDRVAGEIGGDALAVRTDSSRRADLDALFTQIAERHGHLDVVVANAGGGTFAPLGEITEEQFDTTFGANVKGVLFTVQGALGLLGEGSSVIVIGSTASLSPGPAFSVYGATKAAIRALVRGWTEDLRGRGIRLNVLSPGPVETPGLVGLVEPDQQHGLLEQMAAGVPLGRVGRPEEIAAVAAFLASEESSFVNGAELFADGGLVQV